MAEQVLINCQIWHGGYDLSGKHNQISIAYGAEGLDKTPFGSRARRRTTGITDAEISGGGFWHAQGLDDVLKDGLAVDNQAIAISPTDGSPGSLVYMLKGVDGEYAPSFKVGELVGFNFAAYGQGDLVRGVIMENSARSATGSGTARELEEVPDGKKIHAALHVLSISGTGTPAVTVTIDSNDANVWDGSEEERFAFARTTARGAQWLTLKGPVTDTWWRVSWEIEGVNPSILFAVVLGIR